MTDEGWVAFLKRTRAYHYNIIGLLTEGTMTTAEVRSEGLVDTSSETLTDQLQRLDEVEELLEQLAA